MESITTVEGLKNAIRILEAEHEQKEQLLKDQLRMAYENLRPVNLIKNTIKDWISPSYLDLNKQITGTAVGALSSFFLRKYLVGSSGGILRTLLAKIFQMGLTKAAVLKSEDIATAGVALFSKLFGKKRKEPEEEAEE